MRIAALMTCHNRVNVTKIGIQRLLESKGAIDLEIYLVDDGSTDGTAVEISKSFPIVKLISGNGALYWGGGTLAAFGACPVRDFDAVLLLNDDTFLESRALDDLVACAYLPNHPTGVAVGMIAESDERAWAYGAWRRTSRLNGLALKPVVVGDASGPCDTFSGNCVLVPVSILTIHGFLDPTFRHTMSDFDYGFRLRKSGVPIRSSSTFIGTCEIGRSSRRIAPTASIVSALRWTMHLKRYPLGAWFRFCRRHGRYLWLFPFLSPYVRAVIGRTRGSFEGN